MATHTLVHRLADWAACKPNAASIHGKVNGVWAQRTWAEYYGDVRLFAKGLIALGHTPGECVAIVGDNRMEWVICELAIMAAGGIPAPIYTTELPERVAYIVGNAQAKIAICDTQAQYEKYRAAIADGLMSLDRIITMDEVDGDENTLSFQALLALGKEADDKELDARIDALGVEETGLLIYTSGTTGKPKGVMLEHGGMTEVADAIMDRTPAFASGEIEYKTVSYLPLCHAAEQLLTTMGHLATGGQVYFCDDLTQIKEYLTTVRPSVFLGVPRVWEKFEAALSAAFADATGIKAKLLSWARGIELNAVREQARTGQESGGIRRTLANKILSGVRAKVGFDNIHFAVTGSAPISVGTLEFFASLGVVVYEAYGMSETTGVCTVGEPGRPRFGRVGTALKGVKIRIAEDGEIQLHGRLMTKGYLRLEAETAELYTEDGWLCTGDIGDLDDEGHLAITGRKKELLITAGGKNVAPVEMEAHMQQIRGIAQAVVVGDRMPFLSALVTIDGEALDSLASEFGGDATVAALSENEKFRAHIERSIESQCNAKVARYLTIKKFTLLPQEFSVEGGELTPTMKLRRKEITAKYAAEIAAFYEGVIAKA